MDTTQSAINIENSISHAKFLNSLMFYGMNVSDLLIRAIAKANLPLKKFGLNYCKKFTVEGLLTVLSNYQLIKLCIPGAELPVRYPVYRGIDILVLNGDIGNLTHKDISYCQVRNVTLFLLRNKCPSLTVIRMGSVYFHSITIVHWFPNIRMLDLSCCGGLTGKHIVAILESCKFLRKLILKEYGEAKLVKDDSHFSEVMNLEELDLSFSLIKDEGLSAIAEKCRRLVSLNLRCCNRVTIEGLKKIVEKITTLKCLCIKVCHDYSLHDLLEWMLCTGNFAS